MKILLITTPLAAIIAMASLTTTQAGVTLVPAAGFGITYDGNDGAFFDQNAPPGGAMAPDNAALASNGGVPIGSSESAFVPTHQIANINDGFYGNSSSHINNTAPSPAFSGVILPGLTPIGSIAFGRDNGNGAFDDSFGGTDACGGQCSDRWGAGGDGLGAPSGTYDLQFTIDGGVNWASIGLLTYDGVGGDIAPGGAFTPWLRHEYGISQGGSPVMADGIRLLLPGAANNVAIDEIEIYAVPEPSGLALLGLGFCSLLLRRRR